MVFGSSCIIVDVGHHRPLYLVSRISRQSGQPDRNLKGTQSRVCEHFDAEFIVVDHRRTLRANKSVCEYGKPEGTPTISQNSKTTDIIYCLQTVYCYIVKKKKRAEYACGCECHGAKTKTESWAFLHIVSFLATWRSDPPRVTTSR